MRIGLLASVGSMLDAFFPENVGRWEHAGHQVRTAAGDQRRALPGAVIDGLGRRPALSARRAQRGLRAWSQEEELEVIVTNSATASALVRTARVGVPIVYFCHGLHWNRMRSLQDVLWQAIEHQLLVNTAAVITINSDDERWFRRRVPDHAVLRVVAGVGLDPDKYPRQQLPQGPLRLAWIGEHSARKRPGFALDVMRELHGYGLQAQLMMVGEGSLLERTRSRIRALGLERSVEAIGWSDAAAALADSHGLLHTAQWEGLPRVMLEAVAAGRRTYAFDVKGVRDIPGAQLAPDRNVAALAHLIWSDWATGASQSPLSTEASVLSSITVADQIDPFLHSVVHAARPDQEHVT